MATLRLGADRAGLPVAISAHRGGQECAQQDTYAAYRSALAVGADYLEFDVRRTADGELIACHSSRLRPGHHVGALTYASLCRATGYEVPTASGLLHLLADHGAAAHIDLKEPDCLAGIAAAALELLASDRILITTGDAATIGELRRRYPTVPAGLTIGGDVVRAARYLANRARGHVSSRVDAVVDAGASVAVVHYRLALAGALAECRRRALDTVVWTVNDDTALARWLASPDVDVVVTDRPRRAAELRSELSQR